MKNKTKATGAAPPDDRKVLPLEQHEIDAGKKETDERKRRLIHRTCLAESLRRLRAGRQLEKEHGVIHPEMTAITRDVLRLTDLVYPGEKAKELEDGADVTPAAMNDGALKLCELAERASLTKVAKIAGLDPAFVRRLSRAEELPDEPRRVVLEARLKIARDAWDRRSA